MKFNTKLVFTSLISVPLLAGCVTPGEDDANAATKQGAFGGPVALQPHNPYRYASSE